MLYNDDAAQKINITGSTGNLVSKEINYNSLFIHKKDDDGHGFSFYYKSEGERYWGTHSGNFKLNEKTKPIIDSFLK